MPSGFIAYPGLPAEIGKELEAARSVLRESYGQHEIHSWVENDIAGRFLIEPILQRIQESDLLIADITKLNFNVTFEVGYAIGASKRVFLVKNSLVNDDAKIFPELGIFDTLGYQTYSTGSAVAEFLSQSFGDLSAIPLFARHTGGRPRAFLVEPPKKDSYDIALASAVKKSHVPFERYDPQEKGRLPHKYAIESICFADAVIARLLPPNRSDNIVHNTRVAFCLGIAHALDRDTLVLQDSEFPVPLDYRELVQWVPDPNDISQRMGELGLKLWDQLQTATSARPAAAKVSVLSRVEFGSPIAENESRQLSQYYLETADFKRAQKGEYQAITGRKGSGKTAFFLELRNSLRRNPNNIILDLQPEGYQLLKFRETTLATLVEGSKQHLLTALWEYVLLLEIAHRILRDDKSKQINDHTLQKPYHNLAVFLAEHELESGSNREGDFAERLENVMSNVAQRIGGMVDAKRDDNTLSYPKITELLQSDDIHELARLVYDYVDKKEGVWILVDNIDKGWPATGIQKDDLTMVRCLQDALFKIEKPLLKKGATCHGVLFLRSDVYDRLITETPDKGKTLRASLDLSNPEILEEILRRRIAYSLSSLEIPLAELWPQLCVSHIAATGEDSLQFLLDRSLMRPRGLLEIVRSCQSTAVTLQHDRIEEADLSDGLEAYSVELATNISLEIRDVYPDSPEVIYALLGSPKRLQLSRIREVMLEAGLEPDHFEDFIEVLLRYGVFGLIDARGEAQYIYHHRYEIRRLRATQSHLASDADPMLEINPAFWSALEIDSI